MVHHYKSGSCTLIIEYITYKIVKNFNDFFMLMFDSHTNMFVCGKYCHILACSRMNVTVLAFVKDVNKMNVPIVRIIIVRIPNPSP